MRKILVPALFACDICRAATPALLQDCLAASGGKYGIPPQLLWAIAATESNFNPMAIGRNAGSRDIGLMQINSGWLPRLAAFGITPRDLLDPCTNIEVGAWILAHNIRRYGYTWQAVGAYNAVTPAKRERYARRVWRKLQQAMRTST